MHHLLTRRLIVIALVLPLTLGVTGCGDDDEPASSGSKPAGTGSSVSGSGSGTDGEGSGGGSGSTEDNGGGSGSSSGSEPVDEGDLPGERIEIYPYKGAVLGVIGVEADDTLNVRSGPGTSYDVVTELGPLAEGFTATGHNRTVGESFWVQVDDGLREGWVNGRYVSHLGGVSDVTAQIHGEVDGDTMRELAEEVAEKFVGPEEDEGPRRRFVVVDAPPTGDLGEITVDVTGLGDDAQTGYRLHVFGTPDEDGGDGFHLKSVEAAPLCTRGVTDDGLCQ